jgi:DNA-binding response OmpR family regulator
MVTRILVVDDEPRYVRLMEANLISEGYQVLKAYDGQGAVEMVAEDQPDLVLLDVMMPGLNGFGACEQLLARVRAVLRRAQVSGSTFQQSVFNHGNLQIDLARAEVFKDEKMVFLSATEYRLLLQFVHNLGSILTSEDLLVNVWGPEYREDKEILWVSISRLRQKLEDDPRNPQHIVTRSGMGYTMPPS